MKLLANRLSEQTTLAKSLVIPAKAGIQEIIRGSHWIPAFAEMTEVAIIAESVV